MMKFFLRGLAAKFEFWQQLVIALVVGFVILAVVTSISVATINNRSVKSQVVQQASYLTEMIANQSRLALLYQSMATAEDVAAVALQFPDVVGIAIVTETGDELYREGVIVEVGPPLDPGAGRFQESDDHLVFVAPVFTEPVGAPSWDMEAIESANRPASEQIGMLTLVYAKDSLKAIQGEILRGTIIISLLVAAALLLVVIFLARRMTGPLNELSQVMERARGGEIGLRADPKGSRDIVGMQRSFNTMMEAIELRDHQLRRARDAALQSAEVQARFAANVSHELRTPMNSVLGMLDLLTYMGLSGKQLEYVETARQSATGLLHLIDDILSYVHADSGEIVIEESNTDLVALVEDVVNLMAPQALRKRVDLGYTLDPRLSVAWLDAQRVRQVLTNLVGNAVKFTDRGEVAIAVELDNTRPGGDQQLVFRIRDTGIGIRPENQQRIFESFTQEDSSTTRKFGGTGLGLAICKQFVALMKGEISVSSERYRGSEFIFSIPYRAVAGDGQPGPQTAIGRARVLVVDDAVVVRNFIDSWVSRRGGEVHCVENLNSLLSLIEASDADKLEYTHLFVDEQLSGTLLWDLLRLLRSHESTRHAVISLLVNPWVTEPFQGVQGCFPIEKPLTEHKLQNFLLADRMHGFQPRRHARAKVFADDLNKKILVVDDNRANRLVASAMLEQFGCDCDFAQNGQEALDRVLRKPFDMVLMDCNMPVMDGYQSSRAIRETPEVFRDLPIIAMTANNTPEEIQRCLDAGMNSLLVKPLSIEALNTLLREWFGGQDGAVVRHRPPNILDTSTLESLRESVGELFVTVVQAFIDDLPSYLASLRAAISLNDSQQVHELAHTIKGSAVNVGAQVVAGLSRNLEQMGKARDLRGAEAIFNSLESALADVIGELRGYLKNVGFTSLRDVGSDEQAVLLVADDDRATRLLYANALRDNGYRILEAGNGMSVVALCARSMPDVILLDAIMPEMDGFETCRKIRQLPNGSTVPILMITSLEDEQSVSHAFSVGATDFVTKPVNFSVLRQRVNRLLQTSRVERHVRKLAYSDSLTGLPNRAAFSQQLRHKINRASLNGSCLAVLFLDLDRFKMINDSLGHDAGDLVLKAAADRLRHCVRASDFVARIGGDEFTVVLEEVDTPDAVARVAEKICVSLREPFVFLQQRIFVGASIGIALYPRDGGTMNTLLKHADTAMFKAKERDQDFCFYEPIMEDEVNERVETERDLRASLEQDEIIFYYQPQVSLASGAIVAFESLVRWRHPVRGLVPAARFIDIAEDSGLTGEFGRLALDEGCRLLSDWHGRGLDLRLAINTSGELFQKGLIRREIAKQLDKGHFPPAMLEVEITESTLMAHPEEASSEIALLREQGLSIAIDDFGSGFSSLNYLKRFSVDVLKIDREFVRDCHEDPKDQAIIIGIVTLAKSLGLQVVAEGVELQEQVDFLGSVGCDMAQGYFFGAPMSREDMEAGIESGELRARQFKSLA